MHSENKGKNHKKTERMEHKEDSIENKWTKKDELLRLVYDF